MDINKMERVLDIENFTGVPDSQLKPLCNYLMDSYGISRKHIIAANEGNATALAAGYHLATGKVPVVYMQNSGIGNMINPVVSLLNDKVYAIPCIFIIGWRGEPGTYDEPQHIYQGEITMKLIEEIDIATFVITKETNEGELSAAMDKFKTILAGGKSVAFVVKKDAFEYGGSPEYTNSNKMNREDIIRHITKISEEDIIISTTGKASRELFEIREENRQSHKYDFLTVGSMGHSSSIALGVALNKPSAKVWCIDGDGAALMHMGAMAVVGSNKPENMVHIIINNGAHETVGGMPTVAKDINWVQIALGCGYPEAASVDNFTDLDKALLNAKYQKQLMLIEVKTAICARVDLGRPTTTARANKEEFMEYLETIK